MRPERILIHEGFGPPFDASKHGLSPEKLTKFGPNKLFRYIEFNIAVVPIDPSRAMTRRNIQGM